MSNQFDQNCKFDSTINSLYLVYKLNKLSHLYMTHFFPSHLCRFELFMCQSNETNFILIQSLSF